MTRKPNKQELGVIVKVTGIGMLIIGIIGFIVHLLWQMILR